MLSNYSDCSICIPVYNEEKIISKVIEELKISLPGAEIIVVNDGSSDKSLDVVSGIKNIRTLTHDRNIGYGGSLKTAMRASTKSIVAWYDGDGQHKAKDLQKALSLLKESLVDAVIGVRDHSSDLKISRMPGKFLIKIIAHLVVRHRVPDINSGLRCFKKDVITKYLHLLPNGFSASSTSTIVMMKRGYRIGYVSISTVKRTGTSSVKILKDGVKTIKLIIRMLILFDAFNFFTILSLIQIIPATIYGIHIALMVKLGFPTLAAVVVISGLLTFFIGIVSDQISQIRIEKFEQW
ncbi:MAG: glycosyltransferase family 2 protein [Oligoflexia bacterium]|nr:glycosyltransferase family 2 protein [Oligoflexia bacterium]